MAYLYPVTGYKITQNKKQISIIHRFSLLLSGWWCWHYKLYPCKCANSIGCTTLISVCRTPATRCNLSHSLLRWCMVTKINLSVIWSIFQCTCFWFFSHYLKKTLVCKLGILYKITHYSKLFSFTFALIDFFVRGMDYSQCLDAGVQLLVLL